MTDHLRTCPCSSCLSQAAHYSPHAQKSKGFCSLGWTTVCGPAVEAEAKLRFPVLLWSLNKWLALTWGHCQVWLPHEPALPYRLSSLPGEGCRRIFLNCGFPDIFRQQNSCFRLKSYLKHSTYKRIKAVLIEAQTLSYPQPWLLWLFH